MNGSMTVYLTVATVTLLGFSLILTRMLLDYRSRESQSRSQQTKLQMEMMAQMVTQSGEVVKAQNALTELILVGRPMETVLLPEPESPSVTLPTQDELFRDLPDNIREAMVREVEEAGTWPNLSERPPAESDISQMEEQLRASLSPFGGFSEPQPVNGNSG